MSRLGLSVLCTLALAACGSGPISADDGSSAETGTGDDTGGDGSACIDGDDRLVPGALLLEASPVRARLIDGGAEIDLPLAGDDDAESLVGAANADTIAIARVDVGPTGRLSVVQVFSRSSGELLWTREIGDVTVARLWVGEDGWISGALDPTFPGILSGFVLTEDDIVELPDHLPMAAPKLGHVAVHQLIPSGVYSESGWIELASGNFRPASSEQGGRTAGVSEDDHTLEYFTDVDGVVSLVRTRPNETETIVLPFAGGFGPAQTVFAPARNNGYRALIYHDFDISYSEVALADTEAGEAVLIDPELPQGWSFFDCSGLRSVAVDGHGRIIFELHDGASARAWAYDVATDEWTPLGRELANVEDMEVVALSVDVGLVRGDLEFFCDPFEWAEPPEGALLGDSYQLVRLDPALELVLPAASTGEVHIDREQRCAASVVGDAWEVRPLDGSDRVLDFGPGSGDWIWLD
jgi:hypothetical protein